MTNTSTKTHENYDLMSDNYRVDINSQQLNWLARPGTKYLPDDFYHSVDTFRGFS